MRFEFKVVPAPRRAEKLRGVKTIEDRFALTLQGLMNSLGAEGWDYVRADTLPVDERAGLTGTKTHFEALLVFRRLIAEPAEANAQTTQVVQAASASPLPRLGGATEAAEGAARPLGPATTGEG